jgi:predicted MFS family arabinose efflux permease
VVELYQAWARLWQAPERFHDAEETHLTSKKGIITRLIAGNLLLYFGFSVWRSLFNNFAIEELAVRADQIGLIQSIREIPGLLGFWLAFVALVLSEMQVISLSTVVMGLGLMATAWAGNWGTLIAGTVLSSIGFHAFYPNSSGLAIKVTRGLETPRLLGIMRAAGAFAAVIAAGAVILTVDLLSYRQIFMAAGAVTAVGGLAIWRRERGDDGRQRQRIVIRRRYWLYYLLTFLMGSRRHMFTTFAIFLLVQRYGLPAQQTALLMLINNLLGTFLFRFLGDLVGRVGERLVLTANFLLLTGIFLGYAFLDSLVVLSIFYVLDNLLFSINLSLESYFKKIAVSPEEITSSMSVGQTINHVAALFVPILGGLIWETYGSAVTFMSGAGIAVISLVVTQFMRPEKQAALEPVRS